MNQLDTIHTSNGAVMGERNDVKLPFSYGDLAAELKAVRENILMVDYSHFGIVEVSGEDGYELLNTVVAGDLSSIRDEQAIYTVMLDQDGKIITDLYVLCDDERFILLSEWLKGEQLVELLNDALANTDYEDIGIRSLNDEFGILHFEGPYSWELMAEFYGMDVLGLPFMEFMNVDDINLFRSGKHGEYSYKVIAEKEQLAKLWQRALEDGEKFDLKPGGLDYQDQVRLENPCWDPRVYAQYTRCPIELQIQWTIHYDKTEFIGQEALNQKLADGIKSRAVGFTVASDKDLSVAAGDKVYLDDQEIGYVITSGYSTILQAQLGRLFIVSEYAYADILDRYSIESKSGRIKINTAPIPFLKNYSFLISQSEHSYVDPSRPKNLLEQLERLRLQEEEKKAAEALAAKEAQ